MDRGAGGDHCSSQGQRFYGAGHGEGEANDPHPLRTLCPSTHHHSVLEPELREWQVPHWHLLGHKERLHLSNLYPDFQLRIDGNMHKQEPVSYTHLTLPTIYPV